MAAKARGQAGRGQGMFSGAYLFVWRARLVVQRLNRPLRINSSAHWQQAFADWEAARPESHDAMADEFVESGILLG